MTRDEFERGMGQLITAFHQTVSQAQALAYWELFHDLSALVWEEAVRKCLLEPRWPTRLQLERAVKDAKEAQRSPRREGVGRACHCGAPLSAPRYHPAGVTFPLVPFKGTPEEAVHDRAKRAENWSFAALRECLECGKFYVLAGESVHLLRTNRSKARIEKGYLVEIDPTTLDLGGVAVPDEVEASPHSPEYARARMELLGAQLRRCLGPKALGEALRAMAGRFPDRAPAVLAEAMRYEQGATWEAVRKADEVPF